MGCSRLAAPESMIQSVVRRRANYDRVLKQAEEELASVMGRPSVGNERYTHRGSNRGTRESLGILIHTSTLHIVVTLVKVIPLKN